MKANNASLCSVLLFASMIAAAAPAGEPLRVSTAPIGEPTPRSTVPAATAQGWLRLYTLHKQP